MVKCDNCHKKVESIDKRNLCQDCAEAFRPDEEYTPIKVQQKYDGLKKVI